jgi:hypothetical protein
LQNKIPGNFLFRIGGVQGITPGQIHYLIFTAFKTACPICQHNGFTGPVSGVLLHFRKGVENGALAYVRVPGQGDNWKVFGHKKAPIHSHYFIV